MIILVLLLLPVLATAQTDSLLCCYAVRYEKEHLYYHRDREMNVVNVEVEWPEVIDGQRVEPLQQFLSRKLFGVDATTFAEAYGLFRQRFGTPVTQLDTIPDDDRYCHVDCVLRMLAHQPGRYVSYFASIGYAPGRASSLRADTLDLLFTYDLQHRQVLCLPQLFQEDKVWDDLNSEDALDDFTLAVVANAIEPIPQYVDSLSIDNACIIDDNILIRGSYVIDGQLTRFNSPILSGHFSAVADMMAQYATPACRQLIKNKKLSKKASQTLQQNILVGQPPARNGQPAYASVAQNPQYPGGPDSLSTFFRNELARYFIDHETIDGQSLVDFLVEADGLPSTITILSPSTPELDREIASIIRRMPRWTPGTLDGHPVNTRLKLPIRFAER